MRDIRLAVAQFEHRDRDPQFNLARIRSLTAEAVADGAEMVSFHESCISGYTFTQTYSLEEMLDLAEEIPSGPSVQALTEISREFSVPVLAGLFERDHGKVYNTYVCVTPDGLLAKYRKLHAFVNAHLTSGSDYCVFEWSGCKFGILICYDNNLPENVRMTTLLGAEIVFMPHVTGCLPSPMPGRGVVDPALWLNRDRDPVALQQELWGPKGRGWLMRWLPTRAFENGIYALFTNPIGIDNGQVRNGNSMILDPFGEVVVECQELGDQVVTALCTSEKLERSSGRRYLRARRPELYGKLVEPPKEPPVTLPGWDLKR